MFKKITTISLSIFTVFFAWTLCSIPIFNDYGNTREIYQQSNSSCSEIHTTTKTSNCTFTMRYGEGCVVDKDCADYQQILDRYNAQIVFIERTEFGTSYYAFSKSIPYSTCFKKQKINLQVFVGESYIKLGTPIIYGSY